ncbi:uncharacterized protein LOC142743140 isoform X2 [Rhinoderma darwinii]|uniref:uncharacterized protein LOC142743140 isoform X2 n=1 Tax=Rhinoderma darwinii TaxID=43563 RepID=UPI003F66DEDF
MYHRGGDRGWHRGHHQMDIPPPRNHCSRPYRGAYHDHREPDNYGSYNDSTCQDRSYNDNQFMEYPDNSYPEYYEEKQSFNEYREHREPVYNREGRHDSGYPKETHYRGSYQRGRGESSRNRGKSPGTPHKKFSHKLVKALKENEVRVKTSTPKPTQRVIHNSGRTLLTLTPGMPEDTSETMSSKANSPEQDAKPSQDCDNPSQETAKVEMVKKDVKVEVVVKEIITSPSNQKTETLPACNIKKEITESKTEDTLQSEQTVKVEELPTIVDTGKRAHSEKKDFGACVEQREGESKGCWGDMPSESVVSASIGEQENPGSAVNCELPDTARELRTAFILARKEQLEVAFAQDCKTFAFVASTLLKKDPSIEAPVTSALRSSLQEMAGLCVQELNNFIDHYDSGI